MNVAEERARALRDRAEEWRKSGLIDSGTERAIVEECAVTVRSYGIMAQVAFFFLTAIGVSAVYGLAEVFDLPSGFLTAIVTIGCAEYLIQKKRWFGTGVEVALWLGGMLALVSTLPRTGSKESLLVVAAAIAIAGARVRNPLFAIAVAGLIVAWAESRFDLGLVAALAIAIVAVIALLRTWQRPSNEWLWIVLSVTMPVAGRIAADRKWLVMTMWLFVAFGIFALALAIVRRHHALFVSSAIAIGIAITEFARTVRLLTEVKLAIGAALLLTLSWIVARTLRERTNGFVVTVEKLTPADDAIQIAGALAMARVQQEEAGVPGAETRAEDGGGFGGAGATGKF